MLFVLLTIGLIFLVVSTELEANWATPRLFDAPPFIRRFWHQGHPKKSKLCSPAASRRYERRRPEKTPLDKIVTEQIESELEWRSVHERPFLSHAEEEFRGSLQCGILCFRFVRARCTGCSRGFVVTFSCQSSGVLRTDALWCLRTLGIKPFIPLCHGSGICAAMIRISPRADCFDLSVAHGALVDGR